MAYKIDGSVLSDEMETLAGAEVMELLGPMFQKVETDQDGKFKLTVASPETEIQISQFGFTTVIMKAKDFMSLGYAELPTAVNVSGNKKGNYILLYVAVGVSLLIAGYYAFRKPAAPKRQPKQVKIA